MQQLPLGYRPETHARKMDWADVGSCLALVRRLLDREVASAGDWLRLEGREELVSRWYFPGHQIRQRHERIDQSYP